MTLFDRFGPLIFAGFVVFISLIGIGIYWLINPKRAKLIPTGASLTQVGTMNRYAATALTWASVFLMVMAVLVNSTELFIMAAAIIATMVAAHIQANLAVQALRFEHYSSPTVKVGEPLTVEIIVWSERRIRRPLVTIKDRIPERMVGKEVLESLPIAPSYDQPIKTHYTFKPLRRGRYSWESLTATATDALGLVSKSRDYVIPKVELTVYPSPIPVSQDIMALVGWGASELDEGRHKGSGLEPHGVREYAYGDPLRYVHWRSTARRGKLMVKEFETGSGVVINLILQRNLGSDVFSDTASTFEMMCGNALYLACDFIRKGAGVIFPSFEPRDEARGHPEVRERRVREILTDIQPDAGQTVSAEVAEARKMIRGGETVVIFIAIRDSLLPAAIVAWSDVQVTCVVYDASEFGVLPHGAEPACDPNYIAELEAAGARVNIQSRMENLI